MKKFLSVIQARLMSILLIGTAIKIARFGLNAMTAQRLFLN